jgi:GNAT superfamily N-acetyltransferase
VGVSEFRDRGAAHWRRDVVIKRAELSNPDAAWAIVSEYYEAVNVEIRESLPAFADAYFGPGSGVWLAVKGDVVVGCIALRPLQEIPESAEVKRLYVRPPWRSEGIAAMLLEALEDYARQTGYKWLYLDSKDDLQAALQFYQKHGYVPCERYNQNPQATVFMRRQI